MRGTRPKPLLMNNPTRPVFVVAASLCCLLTGARAQAQETQPTQIEPAPPVQPAPSQVKPASPDATQPTQAPSSGVLLPSQISLASGVELPKPRKRRIPLFGPEIESNLFFSSKTRNRFRPDSLNLNFGFGDPTPSLKGSIRPDVAVTIARHTVNGDTNKLFLISLGPEFRQIYIPPKIKRLIKAQIQAIQAGRTPNGTASGASVPPTGGSPPPPAFPPGGGSAGGFPPGGFSPGGVPPVVPYYGVGVNLLYAHIKSPLEGINGSGFGAGGSVFAGVVFRRRFSLEARVRATTSVKGYNFSRAGLILGVRF
jgi:hypothetical protein